MENGGGAKGGSESGKSGGFRLHKGMKKKKAGGGGSSGAIRANVSKRRSSLSTSSHFNQDLESSKKSSLEGRGSSKSREVIGKRSMRSSSTEKYPGLQPLKVSIKTQDVKHTEEAGAAKEKKK